MKVVELIERLEQLDVMQEDEIYIYTTFEVSGLKTPEVELYPMQGMVVLR